MKAYKVDPELNQVSEIRLMDNLIPIAEYDLGTSDKLFMFSHRKDSSVWVDSRLVSDGAPLIRVIRRELDSGIDYTIIPLRSKLVGSVLLVEPNGICQYNLTFMT